MTSMIDVIFLLLIFFVCTASFAEPEQVLPTRFSLPGAITPQEPVDPLLEDFEEVVVKISDRDGEVAWEINQRRCQSLAEVRGVLEALAAAAPEVPVILDVEPQVALGHVIDVYDVCRLAGFEKVQFAANVEP